MYNSTLPSTSALDGGGWSTPRPGRFTLGERPGAHCIGGGVGPRADLDGRGKSRPPTGFDPRTVQSVASGYTGCAFPAPLTSHIRPINSLYHIVLWKWHRGVDASWNVMAHGDAREGRWRGNWRMEWVASTLHTASEIDVSSITTADVQTSAASSRLNWRPRWFKWTHPFLRKRKSGFCARAITFKLASTWWLNQNWYPGPSAYHKRCQLQHKSFLWNEFFPMIC
jgi:hypothetical protein